MNEPDPLPETLLVTGTVADWHILNHPEHASRPVGVDGFAMSYQPTPTDRTQKPTPFALADVNHLYLLQLTAGLTR